MLPSTADTFDASGGMHAAHGDPGATRSTGSIVGQYSLSQILGIWAAAVVPMVLLAWVATPLVGDRLNLGVGDANREAFTRAGFITLGLVWQFVLVMIIVKREEGDLGWSTIRRRCWLNTPHDPHTGETRRKLWWWLAPFIVGVLAIQLIPLQAVWEWMFPFLAEPDKYSFAELLQSEERKEALEGAWQVLGLFLVLGLFNTVIGEEFLFRGILLPKMHGVFGKHDWIANGLLFGLYHLHQPWSILSSMVRGVLLYALPSRRFRSAWFGIIVHSMQTVFFIFVALGLVLGLA
ncbi:MAG TPA: CPBP family intramembrane glutamic endopeptidase [Thermomicrobiales bacterium]|nr:CPBP family intramembrane glutamic endopeptidase [Thermomicrobiales bacterium]